jgi:HSP20 family molecular chaperone IbpA
MTNMAKTRIKRKKPSITETRGHFMEDLEELSEELTELALFEGPSWDLRSCCIEPLCNVLVTDEDVIVTADLPYTDPDKITVESIDKDRLEIKAEIRRKVLFKELGIIHREGEFQFFRCVNRIPVPVDLKKMKTRFKRGILEVRLPREKEVRIPV